MEIKILTVFALGIVELWAAIPAGLALQLHPVLTGGAAALGGITGAVIVSTLGERVRTWLLRGQSRGRSEGNTYRIWLRYGVAGLGLLAPLLIGAPLGTALGITLGAPAGRLLFWICAGILLWSAVMTLAGALGLAGLESIWQRP